MCGAAVSPLRPGLVPRVVAGWLRQYSLYLASEFSVPGPPEGDQENVALVWS